MAAHTRSTVVSALSKRILRLALIGRKFFRTAEASVAQVKLTPNELECMTWSEPRVDPGEREKQLRDYIDWLRDRKLVDEAMHRPWILSSAERRFAISEFAPSGH